MNKQLAYDGYALFIAIFPGIWGGYNKLQMNALAIEMKQKGVLGKPCPDYVDETVSMKVVRIIQGYVNVVNKMMWRKY